MALSQGLDVRHTEHFWVLRRSGEWGQGQALGKPGSWVGGLHLPGALWGRDGAPHPRKEAETAGCPLWSGSHPRSLKVEKGVCTLFGWPGDSQGTGFASSIILPGGPADIAVNPTHSAGPERWAPQAEAKGLFLSWGSLGVFSAVLENCQRRGGGSACPSTHSPQTVFSYIAAEWVIILPAKSTKYFCSNAKCCFII